MNRQKWIDIIQACKREANNDPEEITNVIIRKWKEKFDWAGMYLEAIEVLTLAIEYHPQGAEKFRRHIMREKLYVCDFAEENHRENFDKWVIN